MSSEIGIMKLEIVTSREFKLIHWYEFPFTSASEEVVDYVIAKLIIGEAELSRVLTSPQF